MEMRFYRCKKCGQMVAMVKKKGCPIMCCGEPMEEIVANTSDGAAEKHVPVYEVRDGKLFVCVGEVAHQSVDHVGMEPGKYQDGSGRSL